MCIGIVETKILQTHYYIHYIYMYIYIIYIYCIYIHYIYIYNVYILVIDRELTLVQQKVSLNKDFITTKNLLETDIMQLKHHYPNTFGK